VAQNAVGVVRDCLEGQLLKGREKYFGHGFIEREGPKYKKENVLQGVEGIKES